MRCFTVSNIRIVVGVRWAGDGKLVRSKLFLPKLMFWNVWSKIQVLMQTQKIWGSLHLGQPLKFYFFKWRCWDNPLKLIFLNGGAIILMPHWHGERVLRFRKIARCVPSTSITLCDECRLWFHASKKLKKKLRTNLKLRCVSCRLFPWRWSSTVAEVILGILMLVH